jgi:uncharacterized protein YgiM (DUF1202 family)
MLRSRTTFWLIGVFFLSLALLTSCGGKDEGETPDTSNDQPPTVEITAPADGAVLPAGQAVLVSVLAQDDKSISRVELYVNNSLIESRVTPPESEFTTVSEAFTWSASIIGSHSLQARTYDSAGQLGASRIVGVEVQLPGASPIAPENSPGPEATSPTGGDTPAPLPPTQLATPEPPQSPMVTATVDANVRNGPGTDYSIVGMLTEGATAPVIGRNADSSWWQINYQGTTAWIAGSVTTANTTAYNAPLASAPPPPPTSTPVPPTPLPTIPPVVPTNPPAPSTGLWADQLNLSAGQCTTLHWDYATMKAFYISLAYGADKDQRPTTGSEQVCPSITTNYAATVVKPDGSQEFPSLTINVSGSGCGDPYITRFAPTTDSVPAGAPFSIFWDVDCAKTVHFVQVGVSEAPVGGHDKKIDVTIEKDTVFQLKIGKNNGGTVNASFTVKAK